MTQQKDSASVLKQAFNMVLKKQYGDFVPPQAFIVPYGIRHLDVLLGSGLTSSAPVVFSSTPETGKTTLALQFCASFLKQNEKAIAMYIDTETCSDQGGEVFPYEIEQRINIFDIDRDRFLYRAIVADIKELFNMLHSLVQLKRDLQAKVNEEVRVLFVLDSIASPVSSRDESSEDPNSTIGYKAREFTFNLGKFRREVAMERISLILIDQVRSNMKIQTKFQPAEEKTVGTWSNFKSATNVSALQHNIRQWLFFSRSQQLKPDDPLGIDGWILNAYTEKNKLVPSQCSVPLVFDKKFGAMPLLSEYYFLSILTKTEKKFWEKESKLIYPLCIHSSGNRRVLTVTNPENKQVMYTSQNFFERDFLKYYNNDENFRDWFNYAVDLSCYQRITLGLFRDARDGLSTEFNQTNDSNQDQSSIIDQQLQNSSNDIQNIETTDEEQSNMQNIETTDEEQSNMQNINNIENETSNNFHVFYNMHTGQRALQDVNDGTLFDELTGEIIDPEYFGQFTTNPVHFTGTKQNDDL